jgi:3-deoxy-7-phosphoheptulonate synthase
MRCGSPLPMIETSTYSSETMKSQSFVSANRASPPTPAGSALTRLRPRAGFQPLPSPAQVIAAMPLGSAGDGADQARDGVDRARDEVRAVLGGRDDRLLVIVGPCSVHDPRAAIDYARWLAGQSAMHRQDLAIVMRAYVEKPRTVTGWRGLVADPRMDGGCDMATGIMIARALLLELAEMPMPAACEWVDPAITPYLADLVSFAAIGARTVESQIHRQLASGLPMAIGFKNGTGGNVQVAADACRAAVQPHSFLGSAPDGRSAIITTDGNQDTCIILRGGASGPNYQRPEVAAALAIIESAGLPRRLIIDASHGNSGKEASRQVGVAATIAGQIAEGNAAIAGVMLESFLVGGRQEPGDLATLTYGQSVTDPCIDTEATEMVLRELAASVRERRAASEQVP